jgi:hypothetical protein
MEGNEKPAGGRKTARRHECLPAPHACKGGWHRGHDAQDAVISGVFPLLDWAWP